MTRAQIELRRKAAIFREMAIAVEAIAEADAPEAQHQACVHAIDSGCALMIARLLTAQRAIDSGDL